jgi:hypothetical protein
MLSASSQMAGSIGERPRFVWMITPVPLMVRVSVVAVAAESVAWTASIAGSSSQEPPATRMVTRCSTTASFTRSRPNSETSGPNDAAERIRSTEGMERKEESLALGGAFAIVELVYSEPA